jgi:hypothetical protein
MRARYYEPATGRFISEDPARDGVNWYLYADGNPVGKVDKNGLMSTKDFPDWLTITGIVATITSGLILSKAFRGVFIAAMGALLLPLLGLASPVLFTAGALSAAVGLGTELLGGAIAFLVDIYTMMKSGFGMAVDALKAASGVGLLGEIAGLVSGAIGLLWLTIWVMEKTSQEA